MSKSLEDLAVISYGKDYKNNPKGDGSIPIIGTGGLMGYTTIPLNEGEAVLTGRKGSINNPLYINKAFWNVDTIFCIKAKEGVNTKWLYYNFCNTDLSKLNEATGVPSVNTASLYRLKFPYFDFDTQTKIAQILTTLDHIIEKTEAAIAKYEAIKEGMMHDLFTRGIGADGQLRPSFEEAPELYEESELGWIPKGWEVIELHSISKINGRVGWKGYTVKDLREIGPLALGAAQIDKSNRIDLSKPVRLSFEKYYESPEIMVQQNDILLVQRGTIGKYTIVEKDIGEATINPSMILINNIKIDARFLYYCFGTGRFSNQIINSTSQTGVPMISQSQVNAFKIVKPKCAQEMSKIAKCLKNIDKKIENEESLFSKQTQLKQGLMQDLLTGKVVVKV